MTARTAFVVGATGLIGKRLLSILLKPGYYDQVIALTRKPLAAHPGLKNLVGGYEDLDDLSKEIKGDDVYCCLGTTMKTAGSEENFRQVDFECPVKVAELALKNGAQQFLIITAMGADPKSSVFYNRVKGEVEERLKHISYPSLHVFRPALLLGPRDEKRLGEAAAQKIFKGINFLFVGPLKKYKAIHYEKVANAMFSVAKERKKGVYIHESDELQGFAENGA